MLDNTTGLYMLIVSAVILISIWIALKIKIRNRPAKIHPRLQKYAGDDAEFVQKRREEASKIVATSSTSSIAGYILVEQVEAVFVDGFRRPEDAIEGIKAVAAMKGANAVINVCHNRTSGGKCSASGDAVIVNKGHQQPLEPQDDTLS